MKKIILSVLLAFVGFMTHAQIINVSTGITTTGSAISSPNPDPQWQIVSPTGLPTLVCYGGGFWESTPVASSNAGWINTSGLQNYTNLVTGLVTYERPFTVSSSSTNINCNFSVAADDNLISVELVRPDNSTVPLSYVFNGYHLSAPITDIVPVGSMSGTWKIRAVVDYVDAFAAFLLSGNVNMDNLSNCNVLYDGFDDSTSWSHPMTVRTCSTYYNDISISGSKFNFFDARDGHVNVFNKALPVALSNISFKADIDFDATAFGPSGNVSNRILGLSAGTKAIANDESSSTCISTPCAFPTMTCQYSPQMALEVRIEGDPTSGYNFVLYENTGAGGYTPLINLGAISAGTSGLGTFYLRLERTSATSGSLSVFSNASRTIHIAGSPVLFSLPATFGGLNNVQLGVYEGGWHANRLTGTLDNLCISNVVPTCTATASNVTGCACTPIALVGSPAGGTFSLPNPFTSATSGVFPYTYTYTDPSTGCVATSSATVTLNPFTPPVLNVPFTLTSTTAAISWSAVPCAYKYFVWYRKVGDPLFSTPSFLAPITSFNITGLDPCSNYELYIRATNQCGASSGWSSVVNFTTPCPNTAPVINLPITTTATIASVSWASQSCAVRYYFYYREAGTIAWSTPTALAPITNLNLSGLSPCTNYEYAIRASNTCGSFTPWSASGTFPVFTTTCATLPCQTPATIISASASSISWNDLGATVYSVWYRQMPSGSFHTYCGTGGTGAIRSFTPVGLTPGQPCEVYIRNKCAGTCISSDPWSPWSAPFAFIARPSMEDMARESNINIFPNPTSGILNIELNANQSQQTLVKVVDITGRMMSQTQAKTEVGLNNLSIDMQQLAIGMYLVEIYADNKLIKVEKIEKH